MNEDVAPAILATVTFDNSQCWLGQGMNVKDVLVAAMQAVNEAGVDDDLRIVAFSKAVDLLSAEGGPARGGTRAAEETPTIGSNELHRLATRLKLDVELVRHVYDIENGELQIVVGQGKLERRASGGTKQLALLVAAGRQGSGLEEWTSVDVVRKWAEQYKRLDAANFAAALKDLENDFTFRGTGRKREVRLTRPGWESAEALIARLAGGAEG